MTRISTALLVLVVLAIQTVAQGTRSPEGTWQGTLDAGQKLRLALTIEKKTNGTYSGSLNSIDQGTVIPIDIITVDYDDSVRLVLRSIGAMFEGKLNADGSELSGQFSQGGAVRPLTFKRAQAATPTASPTPAMPLENEVVRFP